MKKLNNPNNQKFLTKREIQLAELEILKEFIRICNKHSINYYLYAGTALGAARHKGFIPWDDDIDILIPRGDYEKLRKCAKNELKDNRRFSIEFPEDQKKPIFLFAKMYDKSVMLESENGIDTYLWIDLFQLDGLGQKIENGKKYRKLVKQFSAKRFQELKPNDKEAASKPLLHRILAKIYHLSFALIDYEKFVRKMEKKVRKYNYDKSVYFCNNTWSITEKDILKREWLEDTKLVRFEDVDAMVFSGYEHYLENRYGKDYMKLPPKHMRITHTFKAWRVNEK